MRFSLCYEHALWIILAVWITIWPSVSLCRCSLVCPHLFCHQGKGKWHAAPGKEQSSTRRWLGRGQGLVQLCLFSLQSLSLFGVVLEVIKDKLCWYSQYANLNVCLKLLEEEGFEAVMGGAELLNKEPPPVSGPEEKRPSLTLEELEAKQGNSVQEFEDNLSHC